MTGPGFLRHALRAARAVALAVAAALTIGVAAVIAGALLPRNAGWHQPAAGIEIFVRTNGVHADLVLPAAALGIDWYTLAPPEHAADPFVADGWIAIGWGQREFYLETPTWADLRIGTALNALTGGDALMHVEHGSRPPQDAWHRPLRIDSAGYRRMANAIGRSFALADGRSQPLPDRGYTSTDVFYEAEGLYHAFRTSNQWTADMLAEAGVTIGVFTPFEQSFMWRFRQ